MKLNNRRSKLKLTKRLRIPRKDHEEYLYEQGFEVVCGLDEVGRGSWAGPLVAAAVILPENRLNKIRDSKLLVSKERDKLARKIRRTCKFGIGEVSVEELNKLRLTKATQLAFSRAIRDLKKKPDFILVDGFKIDSPIPHRPIKKGDMNCSSIAAASIIAKVYRDKLMRKLDKEIKGYYFAKHKGYGTRLHRERLKKLGPSKAHRMFYKSVK